jgi:branched-chain amino acid transport system permease protein
LTNPWGMTIAGILYGIGESLAAGYLGGSYREIIGFALVILILTLRPNGLLGRSQVEKV